MMIIIIIILFYIFFFCLQSFYYYWIPNFLICVWHPIFNSRQILFSSPYFLTCVWHVHKHSLQHWQRCYPNLYFWFLLTFLSRSYFFINLLFSLLSLSLQFQIISISPFHSKSFHFKSNPYLTIFSSFPVPCGTWKENGIMPAEHLILNMLIVLFIQGFANSASRHAVVLSWIISITSTNICIQRIRGQLYFWVNAEYLMLMCVSYEFERHTLRHFVKVKRKISSFLSFHFYLYLFLVISAMVCLFSFDHLLLLFLYSFVCISHSLSLSIYLSLCLNLSLYLPTYLNLSISISPLLLLLSFSYSRSLTLFCHLHFFILNWIKSMLAVDISETNSYLSLALANQRITEGEVALTSKRSVVSRSERSIRRYEN